MTTNGFPGRGRSASHTPEPLQTPVSRVYTGSAAPGPSIAPSSVGSAATTDDGESPERPATTNGISAARGIKVQDHALRQEEDDEDDQDGEEAKDEVGWMRHGWDSQYTAEQLRELTTNFYMYFNDKRHETGGNPKTDHKAAEPHEWRMRDRLKTVSAVLSICLNIGVDPPDAFKTNPCAKLECWTDPAAANVPTGTNAISQIGKALQTQYEQLSMRTRYKLLMDPTVDETKKYCSTLRRNAKDERILYHYNGHGVPKPTPSGEIWVFNKTYTQYIPISLYDLQTWLGAPSIFVWECSNAGLIIPNFNKFVTQHNAENEEIKRREPGTQVQNFNDCIHLAACAQDEMLPTNPLLPADLFTSCLTTPVEIAVRFFIMCNPLPSNLSPEDASKIPGRAQERRTPIGELNWVFTAITDTIAWNALPKSLFKKLFRQDLMVAALFRNFLLAQRIMRKYGCHPQSYPQIPDTHDDPLWASWDLAIEMVLSQLPNLTAIENKQIEYPYLHSEFFAEQLTAFEIYLEQSAIEQKEPEQLPVVLQVLLSQVHRLRALILLGRFLDLGPWAVNSALCIGIFPYVLKLLQSQAPELKPVMIFIWARILAVDQSCQQDLLKDNGYSYFVTLLNPAIPIPIREQSEHRAMCAFIIAVFCRDFHQGQVVAHSPETVEHCLSQISWQENEHPLLRQWACLCLSMLWKDFPEAKWTGIRSSAHFRLCDAAWDPVPEVRTAVLHALTNFIGVPHLTEQVSQIEEGIASRLLLMTNDGSSLVRKGLVVFFSAFVARHLSRFVVAAYEQMSEELTGQANRLDVRYSSPNGPASDQDDSELISRETVFSSVWKHILILSVDPDVEVSQDAAIIVDYVLTALMRSPLGQYAQPVMDDLLRLSHQQMPTPADLQLEDNRRHVVSNPPSPPTTPPAKTDSYLSLGMKRTASVAASLKNFAFGGGTPSTGGDALDRSPAKQDTVRSTQNDRVPGMHRSSTMNDLDKVAEEGVARQQNMAQATDYPLPKYFRYRTEKERKTLPLQSSFLDWSIEYFREPQMRQNEADEPGSTDYNERLWRRNRNERILESTQKLKEQAGSSRWDYPVGHFDNTIQPMRMCFHQYDNHLVTTDEQNTVRVWDWDKRRLISKFSNGNPSHSQITGVRFINEDDQALLMTGSSDGVIKLFRNYDDDTSVYPLAAFRALTDLVPSTTNAGLVFDWLQGRGWILVAGDAKVIRVWNAATEICTNDIPARSGSCVTSLTSDQVEGHVFCAGFGDGAVRVYDQRQPPMRARIQQWKEHSAWIAGVHMQRGGQRELVSAARTGEVKLWDIRMARSLRTIAVASPPAGVKARDDGLRTLSVHEHAPVFAAGSMRHSVRVFSMDGSFLSGFEPTRATVAGAQAASSAPHHHHAVSASSASSIIGAGRAGAGQPGAAPPAGGRGRAPVAATAFHPHRMMLAAAAGGDRNVYLFECAGGKGGGGGGWVNGAGMMG